MINTINIFRQLIRFAFILFAFSMIACNGQNKTKKSKTEESNPSSISSKEANLNNLPSTANTEIDKNIRSIYQDKKGNYWFGTNGSGVYYYDKNTLKQYTIKDGLSNNQIQSIQEDNVGNIWFGTGVFGVSKYDGKSFTTYTNKDNFQLTKGVSTDWNIKPNDLWFYAGGGVYHYDGNSFVYLPLNNSNGSTKQPQGSPFELSRYAVYSILKDKKGNLWFGTQAQGVCRYDGKTFTWLNEKGLSGSAVLGLFEDSKGILWFGNNGSGLFRYDGKTLSNFTEDNNLSNKEFKISGKSGPGTLARVYTINEDNFGNLWIGTVDAGVWKYDGKNLINYTTNDGLTSNAVNLIYKDKKDELWFGTDEYGICKFNGMTFTEFVIK